MRIGKILRAYDEQSDTVWIVHPFLFEVQPGTVRIDWEHTEYKWIDPSELDSHVTVPKLKETFDRVHWDFDELSTHLTKVLGEVTTVAKDRTHGASPLGRRAVEILAHTIEISIATSVEKQFGELLLVAQRLWEVQPSMATIRNLTGEVLRRTDLIRRKSEEHVNFKKQVLLLTEQVLAHAKDAVREYLKKHNGGHSGEEQGNDAQLQHNREESA